jgi:hypothetical protein
MNTGKHKIWIRLTKSKILIKLTEKKIGNVFHVFRGSAKKNKVSVRKRLSIKRALTKKDLNLQAYMSDFGGREFLELRISEELYRKLKDEADQVIYDYENEREYDEELMVF